MSKQSKKKAQRRRRHRNSLTWTFMCPNCGAADDGSPGAMLVALADVLNLMAASGLKVKVHHGIISAESSVGGGYVLPMKHGSWVARDMTYTAFPQVLAADEMDE